MQWENITFLLYFPYAQGMNLISIKPNIFTISQVRKINQFNWRKFSGLPIADDDM
jgi:hypothetical protein